MSKDTTKLISVIVPIFNNSKYIERCVESIRKQTYKNIEIILVDDGSTDNSYEIIDELAKEDDRIITIHQQNSGVTIARLNGVKKASGEWIGFVDGDDEIEINMYEQLMKNALKNNADISHCGLQMIFKEHTHYFYNTHQEIVQDNLAGLKDLLEGKFIEPAIVNKLFRKSLFFDLINNNKMDYSIRETEDLLMNFWLFKDAKKSVFQDICYYHYFIRDDSTSHKEINNHKIYDPIKVKSIIIENSPSELLNVSKASYIDICIYIYNDLLPYKKYNKDLSIICNYLFEHKNWIRYVGIKNRIKAFGILNIRAVYNFMFRIYSMKIQKKKY